MIETIIDQAWASLLANLLKKRDILRPEVGDSVDLFVPQSRLLALVASDPAIGKLLYSAAQLSAKRNAATIVKKLGMPPDYFWKFEFWPKARAATTLGKLVSRVFSSMMSQAKEGNLEIVDLDVDPLRININFGDCVECAGIGGLKQGICYYHAGAFSGIISGLINHNLDSFETSCRALGDESCTFVLGDNTDEYIKSAVDKYLSPPELNTDLASRLEQSLHNLPVRTLLDNLVDVNYLKLVMASTLLADPQRFASAHFTVGAGLGRKLAPVLASFYGKEQLQNISDYCSQLRELRLEIKNGEPGLQLIIREYAESAGNTQPMEIVSFLLGELEGMASELTKTGLTLKESRFEPDRLVLTFIPKE